MLLRCKPLTSCAKRFYHRSDIGSFFQAKPSLQNCYTHDHYLVNALQRCLPLEVFTRINDDLVNFGEKVSSTIEKLGNECENFPPVLHQYDAWGSRINEIQTCDAWKKMKAISAEEGLISIAYEKKYQEWSRVYQMVKLFLFSPSSGLYSCPLAMTDGAAKILQNFPKNEVLKKAFTRLTSRDPQLFWTSGQWMTERQGGSDVANGTDTRAHLNGDPRYKLYGYKWFSSATDSDVALTLARIVDKDGKTIHGTKGITLFYLETRDENGNLNNIQVEKLKNKLGTRQLPTAELLLDGTMAQKISDDGRGIPGISSMLTLTRLHNAMSSVSAMRRITMLAANYSKERQAFGHPICQYPLHVQTLARMELEIRGSVLFLLEVTRLLGRDDSGIISDQESLMLRIMTPIIKLYTAKQAMAVVSEGLEAFGGQGFIEDTGLPKYLRDSQVLPIWEGTTNILSLDVLRSISKTNGEVLKAFNADVNQKLKKQVSSPKLQAAKSKIESALKETLEFVANNSSDLQFAARDLSYSLARIYIGSLLVQHASGENSLDSDIESAFRWCHHQDLSIVTSRNEFFEYSKVSSQYENDIVFGNV